MKGWYIRYICPYIPGVDEVAAWVGHSVYACYGEHFDGGYMVEVVSPTYPRTSVFPWTTEVFEITCLEFFADAIMATGTGICLHNGKKCHHTPRTDAWRSAVAPIAYHTNVIEISHPHAFSSHQYLSK